jgi:hypothetical protein
MRRRAGIALIAAALALAFAAAFGAASASAAFGLKEFDVYFAEADGTPAVQAGSHPYSIVTTLAVNTVPDVKYGEVPDEELKDLEVELPAGFAGNPAAVPRCSTEDFVTTHEGDAQTAQSTLCPDSAAIGEVAVGVEKPGRYYHAPVYNLVPSPGEPAKFGFVVLGVPVTLDATVNPQAPHNIIARIGNVSQTLRFYNSKFTLWGNPSDPSHDPFRGSCVAIFEQDSSPETPSRGNCPVSVPKTAFLTMPRSCSGPMATGYRMDSWQNPGVFATGSATSHDNSIPPQPLGMTGCEKLGFAPRISAAPTTKAAGSPSGLDFNLDVEDEGLISPGSLAQSDIKKAVVTLPEGISVNPAVAEGLAACTPADYARESVDSVPGEGCPQAAKVGNVEVETPLLEGELLRGSVFVAQPDDPATTTPGSENPFDSLIALYMVIKDPELGILVKLPGKVEANPASGQLVTTFDEIPQFPFAHFRFHFRSGARAPLVTPPGCGTYRTQALFTPWARPSETYVTGADFTVNSGPGGGLCPAGPPPFAPGFEAGSINNNAASYSPFYMRLTRSDGEAELTRFSAVLPPGVTAKLAGVGQCSDLAIVAARTKTGRQEQASPSCPADSRIAGILAGAGAGPELTYTQGSVYLAGPWEGAPLSAVAIVPAVAGPFDIGNVVVRVALRVDPRSAQVTIDGAHSEPLPRILEGIPVRLRDLRVSVDRPDFMLNPTRCDPTATTATLFSSTAATFSRSARYQAAGCEALAFKPSLSLRLIGGTRRNSYPALRATVTYPKKGTYANIRRAQVTLPHSAFLEQGHIRTICTRVQFAAHACPAASVYGHATAYTPILSGPAKGPVYLRSSNHALPDLVMALKGPASTPVEAEVVGRIDSVKGHIRSTFEQTPDLPVSKLVLAMQGGKKGLIVNSRNLCAHAARATADFGAQNGKTRHLEPVVGVSCGKGGKKEHRQGPTPARASRIR